MGGVACRELNRVGIQPKSLFHYTTSAGYDGIIEIMRIRPSLRSKSPKDARYGDGQYLTSIAPGTKSRGSLSYALVGTPFIWRKFTHFVEIRVDGLPVMEVRDEVFLIPNKDDLMIGERFIGGGIAVQLAGV